MEPSLKDGERLSRRRSRPTAGEILGADDQPIVTTRPVLRVGLDKTGLSVAQATDSARRIATLLDLDAKAFVKQVTAGGPQAFVQGDRLPQGGRAGRRAGRPGRHQGRRSRRRRAAAGADQGVRGRDPRHGRPGDRRAGQGEQGPHQGGRRGRPLRPAEEVRRAAGRHPRRHRRRRRRPRASGASCSRLEPKAGSALQHHDRPRRAERRPGGAGRRRPGERPGRHPSLDRRPRRGGQRTRLEGLQHRHLRPLRAGLHLQGGQRARPAARRRHPADAGVAARRRRWSTARRFKNYDDYPSSGLGQISFEDALANSCNTAFIGQRDKLGPQSLAEAAAALGLGVDHDTGFPTFFGAGRHARQRDPGRRQHDRPGHGARLADGDGHRGGVGGQGLGGPARGCCPTTRRSRRSPPSRSPRPRPVSCAR